MSEPDPAENRRHLEHKLLLEVEGAFAAYSENRTPENKAALREALRRFNSLVLYDKLLD